ncbi:MAG: hypothetical protein IKC11_04925 [Clostridia bacterium]|nr:hypothetical protein [Clostridia bacterium]
MKNLKKLDKLRINVPGLIFEDLDPEKEGFFEMRTCGDYYSVVASTGAGWDHVSVSHRFFIPSHEVMSAVKEKFFNSDEVVIEIHPKRAEYINNHSRCLHLWRPTAQTMPVPNFYEFDKAPAEAEATEVITTDNRSYEIKYKKALGYERIEVVGTGKHPTWSAMNAIKEHYFGDEVVVQYHGKASDPKLDKNNTLVLWRPLNEKMPTPPKELVGVEGLTEEDFKNKTPEQIKVMVEQKLNESLSSEESEPNA